MLIPLAYKYGKHPEKMVSVENALNMQPEYAQDGRAELILRSCPGLTQFSAGNANGSEGRGMAFANDTLYAVLGTRLYGISSAGVATDLGRVDGSGRVGIAANSDEIVIATGIDNYRYVFSTSTLSTISGAPSGRSVAFSNGRFVIEDPEATGATAGRFYWSDLMDGSTWNALNFATAEQKPDRTLAVMAYGSVLIVFGEASIEYWQGDASGFVPLTGSTQPIGIAGRFCAAQADTYVCFLASDGSVRLINGYQTVRLSTPAVEASLSADSATEASAYTEQGHTVFEFSTATQTLCYDVTMSQALGRPIWFEKQTSDSRHKASGYIYAYQKNLAIADDDGKVYELTRDVYPAVRQFTTATVADDQNRKWWMIDEIELICRTGSGGIPSDDPQVMLTVSRDNGYTWGEERWAGLGTIGNYGKRIRWRRFGRFQQAAFRFRLTDQVDWTVMGIHARGR